MFEFAEPAQVVDGTKLVLKLPSADAVRPTSCARCGALARTGGRVRLEGSMEARCRACR